MKTFTALDITEKSLLEAIRFESTSGVNKTTIATILNAVMRDPGIRDMLIAEAFKIGVVKDRPYQVADLVPAREIKIGDEILGDGGRLNFVDKIESDRGFIKFQTYSGRHSSVVMCHDDRLVARARQQVEIVHADDIKVDDVVLPDDEMVTHGECDGTFFVDRIVDSGFGQCEILLIDPHDAEIPLRKKQNIKRRVPERHVIVNQYVPTDKTGHPS